MPPTCILNNLAFGHIPECISNLESFSKMFIQRAKVFQVITRIQTVQGGQHGNSPHFGQILQIKGRCFHLPIPIESTLEKLLDPRNAIVKNRDLIDLVRSIPTDVRTIWEKLINVKDIHYYLFFIVRVNFSLETRNPGSDRSIHRPLTSK